MRRIYLDYAASTPVHPSVERAMRDYFTHKFGNPGSLHSFGQEAIAAVDRSRQTLAKAVGAEFREIVFTASATEANNLVLRGLTEGFRLKVLGFSREGQRNLTPNTYHLKPRIIVSSIEHESVLETARDLEHEGVDVVYLPVSRSGVIDLKVLAASLDERTVLVSVMYGNNEIGAIQPIKKAVALVRNFRAEGGRSRTVYPLFHTDAAQAFQFLDCDVEKLGVDFMTLSAHKIYGPKGIGALYIRNSKHQARNYKQTPNPKFQKLNSNLSDLGFRISDLPAVKPLVTGGGQEFGLRSGTENVALMAGFAKAAELASGNREKEASRIFKLRRYFWEKLRALEPKAEINGTLERDLSLPHIANIYFPNHLSEELLVKLDLCGVAVSAGSACSSRSAEPSYVVQALGYSRERARRSIRLSLGRPATRQDIDGALRVFKMVL